MGILKGLLGIVWGYFLNLGGGCFGYVESFLDFVGIF
jgi:hypothetical protein